jgi:SAM-dependent methyltransferase
VRRSRVKKLTRPFTDALDEVSKRAQTGSRGRKWKLYSRAFPPRRGESVLDVGVSSLDDLPGENYFLHRYPYPDQVTAVGIDDLEGLKPRLPEITFVQADGRELPFPDQSFDVVHSNAVIEHVGPRADQTRFLEELVRVGRAGVVTTPNRWFPIETHCRLPLIHWLPRSIVHRLGKRLGIPDLGWWLLSARDLRRMFPEASTIEIRKTRFLGWPLTIVVFFRVAGATQREDMTE